MPKCTTGVAMLINAATMIAKARHWDKDKLIKKLEDAIRVLNGEDAPPHSMVEEQKKEAEETKYSDSEKILIAKAEEMLKEMFVEGVDTITGKEEQEEPKKPE